LIKKSAFTMIELVFVIVVLGILASLAMGRMDRDLTQEASSTVLSNIRLTQQMALRDNKHLSDTSITNWQRAYWKFEFDCTTECNYKVGSDISRNGIIEKNEAAIDPTNGKYLFNDGTVDNEFSEKVLLQKKFGINSITATAGCPNSTSIAFDYLGRPHIGIETATNTFTTIMTQDCNLSFGMLSSDNFIITINAETGHAFIVGRENE